MNNKTLELKNIKSSGEGFITAYASVFDIEDYEKDVVKKGAFIESLKKKVPVMLWSHDDSQPIGVWSKVEEDEKGLYVEGKLLIGTNEKAREVYDLIKNGAISGLSIGYTVDEREYNEKGIRIIKRATLFEISLVSIPCNDEARIISVKSLKSLENIRDIEDYLKSKNLTNNEAKSLISNMKKVFYEELTEKVNYKNELKSVLNYIKKSTEIINK